MLISSYIFCQRIRASDEQLLGVGEIADESDEIELNEEIIKERSPEPVERTPKKRPSSTPNQQPIKKSPKVQKANDNSKDGTNFRFAIPQFIISADKTEFIEMENSKNIKTMSISTIVPNRLDDFADFYSFIEHDDRNDETIYKCKYCPKAFSTAEHLILHNRKVHLCQHCLEPFAMTSDLSKHTKEVHRAFDCLICDKSFRSNGNLRQHMRNNHSIYLPAQVTLMAADKL